MSLRGRLSVPKAGPTSLPIPLRGEHPGPAAGPPALGGLGAPDAPEVDTTGRPTEGAEVYGAEPGTIAAPGEPGSSSSPSSA